MYELSRRADTNLFSLLYMTGQTGAQVTEKGTLLFEALLGPNGKPPRVRRSLALDVARSARRDATSPPSGTKMARFAGWCRTGTGRSSCSSRCRAGEARRGVQPVIIASAVVVTIGSLDLARWRARGASLRGGARSPRVTQARSSIPLDSGVPPRRPCCAGLRALARSRC